MTGRSPGERALAAAVAAAADVLAGRRKPGQMPRVPRRRLRDRLHDVIDETLGGRLTRIFALRLMASIGVAEVIRQTVSVERSYWVVLTVAIVLRPDLGSVFARALQRGIGTVVGAVLGAVILILIPAGPLLLVPVAVFAALLPYGRERNWGLFSTFLTPLVVLLIDLLRPIGWGLALDRLIDTLIGCAIVLLVGYAPWPSSWHAHLPLQLATALDMVARYTDQALLGAPGRSALRRTTYRALSDLRAEFQRTMAEPPSVSRRAARLWPALIGLEHVMDTVIATSVEDGAGGLAARGGGSRAAGDRAARDGGQHPGRPAARRQATAVPRRTPSGGRRHPGCPAAAGRRPRGLGAGVSADWRTTARDGLVVLLTVTTGAVDAASFLYLGHVFCSVITGTMVLLGISVGTHDPGLALNCGVALVSYVVGVVAGTPLAVRRAGRWLEGWPVRRWHRATKHHEIWPSWLTVALAVEFCMLALFSLGWELASGRPSGVAQRLLLAAAGVAMGIQGATIRQLGEISTTYLTGTLTGVISALATGRTTRWAAPQPGHLRCAGDRCDPRPRSSRCTSPRCCRSLSWRRSRWSSGWRRPGSGRARPS